MEKQAKRSFVFNIDWRDVLMDYPAEVRYEVYDAIIDYAASGKLPELKPLAKMAFSFIKKEMDFNNERYNDIVAKRREAGKKGMASRYSPQKEDGELTKLTKGNKTNKRYQHLTSDNKTNNNEYDNDKETVSTDVEPVKKGANAPKERAADAATHEPHGPSERYSRFQQWLAKECPYIPKHFEKTISEREFEKLLETYSARQLCDVISEINNRGDLRKRYTDLYRTALNWLKRENTPKT